MQVIESILEFLSTPVGVVILTVSGIMASFLIVYLTYRQVNLARQTNLIQAGTQRSKFPFDRLTVEELFDPKILNRFKLTNADIQYILRLPSEQHEEMISSWHNTLGIPGQARLMIRGGTGLGKTREVLEFLKRFSQELPNDKRLTILIPRPDLDVPQELPNDLPLENLILLVNDLHLNYAKAGVALPNTAPENEPFHSRLQKVVEWFEDKTKGYGPFRAIITVRSEPELWERISPDEVFWKSFSVFELPRLHSSKVTILIDAVVENIKDIVVESNAKLLLAEKSDGSFNSVIQYLKTEEKRGTKIVSFDIVKERFFGVYRDVIEKLVYVPFIKPYPERSVILVALDILNQAGLPFIEDLVVELSAHLLRNPLPLLWRRWKIRNGISALDTWIQSDNGLLYCPEAYFENRGDIKNVLSILTSVLIKLSGNFNLRRVLYNPIYNFGLLLSSRFKDVRNSIRLFTRLIKLNPTNHAAYYELADALFWEGRLTKAEYIIKKAILQDPSIPKYHVLHADILSTQGKLSESSPYYKTAVRLTSQWSSTSPWAFYEYSNYLMTIGRADDAIGYLEQSVNISPDYVSSLCILALELKKRGNNEDANKYATMAINTTPWSVTGYMNVGRVYRELFHDLGKAIEFHNGAEVIGNNQVFNLHEVFLERSLAYVELGKSDLAQEDFRKIVKSVRILLKRCHLHPEAMYTLSFALLMLGKNRDAERTLRRAKKLLSTPHLVDEWKEKVLANSKFILRGNANLYLNILEGNNENNSFLLSLNRIVTLKISEFLVKRIGPEIEERVGEQMSPGDLDALRNSAMTMQKELHEEEIEISDEGVKVVIGGDQEIRYLEIDGQSEERIMRVVQKAIRESQKAAAMQLLKMSGLKRMFKKQSED